MEFHKKKNISRYKSIQTWPYCETPSLYKHPVFIDVKGRSWFEASALVENPVML